MFKNARSRVSSGKKPIHILTDSINGEEDSSLEQDCQSKKEDPYTSNILEEFDSHSTISSTYLFPTSNDHRNGYFYGHVAFLTLLMIWSMNRMLRRPSTPLNPLSILPYIILDSVAECEPPALVSIPGTTKFISRVQDCKEIDMTGIISPLLNKPRMYPFASCVTSELQLTSWGKGYGQIIL